MASSIYILKGVIMRTEDREVWIIETRGHWEVYVNGEFFCTADSYTEALNELYEVFK